MPCHHPHQNVGERAAIGAIEGNVGFGKTFSVESALKSSKTRMKHDDTNTQTNKEAA